ncbi:MAG: TIGR01777 family oxidoreductase [Opitutaceae bacterium]|nr:TIGR01777 family oxidoreductase [Opitutaceae bacterium]
MSASTFSKSILIHRPASEVKAWLARPCVAERLTPPWWREENPGAASGCEPAGHVCRVQEEGAAACVLTDEVAGAAGDDERLARLFAWRHTTVSDDLELLAAHGAVRKMKFAVAGASGLIGRALMVFLRTQGHEVLRLARREVAADDELFWDPEKGALDAAALRGVDVIVNLAGEDIAAGRWTASRREAIRGSRVRATRTLVAAVEKMKHRPHLLVNASASGFYGDRGDTVLDESGPRGNGFLAEVCEAWEREALAARELGLRVVLMRFGMVLSPEGGALARLLPAFRGGRGGRLGDGRHWVSWALADDAVGAIYHAVLSQACEGPVNAASPNPVTGAEFAATLARVLGKTAWLGAPAWALRLKYGAAFADGLLLASRRLMPERLLDSGFIFRHARLETALRHVLGKITNPK